MDKKEPQAYTAKDVQAILGLSRTAAYKLISDAPFPVIRIGRIIRISKKVFDAWLTQQ